MCSQTSHKICIKHVIPWLNRKPVLLCILMQYNKQALSKISCAFIHVTSMSNFINSLFYTSEHHLGVCVWLHWSVICLMNIFFFFYLKTTTDLETLTQRLIVKIASHHVCLGKITLSLVIIHDLWFNAHIDMTHTNPLAFSILVAVVLSTRTSHK